MFIKWKNHLVRMGSIESIFKSNLKISIVLRKSTLEMEFENNEERDQTYTELEKKLLGES